MRVWVAACVLRVGARGRVRGVRCVSACLWARAQTWTSVRSLSIIVPDMKERREARLFYEDLCLICCVLSRLSTGMHAADLQNLLIVLPIYPVILVYSTIRVLF